MRERHILNLVGALILLGFGVFIGTAIVRLWLPAPDFAPSAQAAPNGNSTAPAPPSNGAQPAALPARTQGDTAPERETPIVRTVRQVSPAVVTVGAVKRHYVAQPWVNDYYSPIMYFRILERHERLPYMGSGFLVDGEEGFVVTNYHVIEDSEAVFVTFPDGREFDAEMVDADKYIDVALLRIKNPNGDDLPEALPLAGEDDLMIGEQIMAVGNPFGYIMADSRPTVTVGYVSAMHRNFRPDVENERVYTDMIQTDAAINPGNSGGPLVDVRGRVVGVNTFIFSPTGASAGVGFAIPVSRIRAFLEEIRSHGRLRPLLLDFDFRTVQTPDFSCVEITEVNPTGPAKASGLQAGDLLVEADGRPVTSREDFYLLFASKQVGEQVRLRIIRQGELLDKEYQVHEASEVPGERLRT